MTRLAYLPALFAVLTSSGGSTSHAPEAVQAPRPPAVAAPRPNIVWISNEDMSPHLGVYGDPIARTPTLDRLATQSIRFTRAFTTAPVCAPSRAAIITGMYQTAIGAQHMRTTEDTVPELPGPYLAVPPFYVKAFPGIPARRRLLHQQPGEDRLPVRDAVHDLGRPGQPGALAQSRRQVAAVLLGVQPRDHAREPDLPVEPGAQGQAARYRRGEDQGAPLLSRQPGRPRRARADVRQHRRHGRPGRGDPPPAGGRRPGRQHHRVLLERSRRRRAARQALALRFRPARPVDDSRAAASRAARGAGNGQRRAGQLHRSCADGSCPRRRRRSRAHAGPRAGRAGEGTGAGLCLRGPRPDGCRIRHDAVGPRRALPLHPQLLSRAALRRAHHLPQPERDHAGVAQDAGRGRALRPRGAVDAHLAPGRGALRRAARSPSDPRTSPPSQPIAPRSNGCARRSPSG